MVIPELLAAVGAGDEDEQRALAASLPSVAAEDDIHVTKEQEKLIVARHDEIRADPTLSLDREQADRLMRQILAQ